MKVGHPSEVDEIFDNISYNKGASVIRMLYNWIGGLGLQLWTIMIIIPIARRRCVQVRYEELLD